MGVDETQEQTTVDQERVEEEPVQSEPKPAEPPPEQPQPEPEAMATNEEFQYQQFNAQERLAGVRAKERELESQHFQQRLNLIISPAEQADNIVEQISTLESGIMELRAEEQQIEQQQQSEQQAQEQQAPA